MDKFHLVATVSAERMLFSQVERAYWSTGIIPEERQDKFVLGYLWGFLDASAQRVGLDVNTEDFVGAASYTYEKLLGGERGLERLREGIGLQESRDPDYLSGMELGGQEVVSWVQSGADMRMVSDSTGNSAADGKVVVGGSIPKGLYEHLVRENDYDPQEHSCRFCEMEEEDLKNELAKVFPGNLRFDSDVAPIEGLGVAVMHPEIPIFPVACVERDRRPDSLDPPMPECCLFVRFPLLGNFSNRPYQRPANLEDCRRQITAFLEGRLAESKNSAGMPKPGQPGKVSANSSGCLVFVLATVFGLGYGILEVAKPWI